ncbi:unnamed protein product [Merluccius merluccius]
MGARESRPRLSQVAPVHSQDGEPEAQEPGESKPQWTLPALALPAEQRTSLPPLRRTEATLSTLSGQRGFWRRRGLCTSRPIGTDEPTTGKPEDTGGH